MSEIEELKLEFNNYKARTDARLSSQDQQIKAFYTAMESIHVLAKSMSEVFSGGAPAPVSEAPVEVAKSATWPVLESGKYVQKITGTIVDDIVIREVETRRGPSDIANFKFTDGVTVVRVALWGDLAKEIESFGKENTVTLTGMSIKDPYEGVQQISSTRNTTIE